MGTTTCLLPLRQRGTGGGPHYVIRMRQGNLTGLPGQYNAVQSRNSTQPCPNPEQAVIELTKQQRQYSLTGEFGSAVRCMETVRPP